MYPKLVINIGKLKHNTKFLVSKLSPIKVMGVTKVFCAYEPAVQAMIDGGISYLADSRLENLEKMETKLPKVLLRIPMQSELDKVVQIADIVLVSEVDTINKLNEEAKKQNRKISIILMFDLGDLREGFWFENGIDFVDDLKHCDYVNIMGIGTNLTCYGGIIPSKSHLYQLNEIKSKLYQKGIDVEVVSGGNSSSLYMNDLGPINNLRIGEAICLGRETAYGDIIEGLYDDAFILEAEVIEVKDKPSFPIGEIGMDAFGNKPSFIDVGVTKRIILAVGKQDVDVTGLIFENKIIGASSDHLIIEGDYKLGEIVRFKLTYGALLALSTSPYVKKEVVK